MKNLIVVMVLAGALAGCNAESSTAEAPPVAVPDNSEAEQLLGLAEQHQALAITSRELVDSACRTDKATLMQVVRDVDAAYEVWRGMSATDYVKIQRNSCLNALGNIRSMALNCAAPEFNTYAAAAEERHYAEDLASCEAMIQSPEPLELTPGA